VTGTQGYPEPRRWDAERHWKRTDNKKKLIMTEHEFKLSKTNFTANDENTEQATTTTVTGEFNLWINDIFEK